jgi:hypothetical protein
VHDESSLGFGEIPGEGLNAIRHPRSGRRGEFGLDGDDSAACSTMKSIHAGRRPPEIHAGLLSLTDLDFDQFRQPGPSAGPPRGPAGAYPESGCL